MRTLVFVGLLSLIAACSSLSSTPSEQDARIALESAMKRTGPLFYRRNASEFFTVQSFRKTNGILGEKSGVKSYTLEFESEWRALTDLNNPFYTRKDNFRKGDLVMFTGTVDFIRTEKGWRASAVRCYRGGIQQPFCDN